MQTNTNLCNMKVRFNVIHYWIIFSIIQSVICFAKPEELKCMDGWLQRVTSLAKEILYLNFYHSLSSVHPSPTFNTIVAFALQCIVEFSKALHLLSLVSSNEGGTPSPLLSKCQMPSCLYAAVHAHKRNMLPLSPQNHGLLQIYKAQGVFLTAPPTPQ